MSLTEEQRRNAEAHIPLAKAVVRPWARSFARHAEDIYAAGLLGLTEAAGAYRPGSEAKFSTYARHRIRGEILDLFRGGARSGLAGLLGKRHRDDPDRPRCFPCGGSRDLAAAGLLPAPDRPPDLDEDDEAEALLRRLPPRHAAALRMLALEGLTQQEVASRLGCSQVNVSRLVRQSRILLGGSPCSC
jgi:RNA polymerase sigma factor (sigma-70 family)